jgi:hypothetical protein
MECRHGQRVWYVRGATPWVTNRIGLNCIPCWQRELRLHETKEDAMSNPKGYGDSGDGPHLPPQGQATIAQLREVLLGITQSLLYYEKIATALRDSEQAPQADHDDHGQRRAMWAAEIATERWGQGSELARDAAAQVEADNS